MNRNNSEIEFVRIVTVAGAFIIGIGTDVNPKEVNLIKNGEPRPSPPLASCGREALRRAGKPPDRGVLCLVDLCLTICRSFGVGNDSAQAEIAGAQWAGEMGDFASARARLREAEALILKLDSTYDQAFFLEVRAELEIAQPTGATDPLHDRRTAEGLFAKLGDKGAVARVQRMLQSLHRV